MTRASAAATDDKRWERRPDDRPRLLMASALKLLRRRGYRRVRLEDVARDAGVCKATVYHYFANKDDLLTRSVASRMAEKRETVARRLTHAGGTPRPIDFVCFFTTTGRTRSPRQSGLWQRLVIGEMAAEAPDVFAAWARGLVEQWRSVEALIKEGQATGEFRRDADAEVTARLIVSALAHQAMFHVHLGVRRFAPCSVDRLSSTPVSICCGGIRPRPRPMLLPDSRMTHARTTTCLVPCLIAAALTAGCGHSQGKTRRRLHRRQSR